MQDRVKELVKKYGFTGIKLFLLLTVMGGIFSIVKGENFFGSSVVVTGLSSFMTLHSVRKSESLRGKSYSKIFSEEDISVSIE